MITSTPIIENVRKAIVHLVVLLIMLNYLFIPYILNSDFPANQWNIYSSSILSISFYIHTFLLLPILIKKKKSIKYLILTFLGFLLVAFSFTWIEAIRSSEFMSYYTNTRPEPFQVFNDLKGRIILFLGLAFIPFLLISSAYYTLSVNKPTRKGILSSKYTELIVNIIVFASIIFLFFMENESSNFMPVLVILGLFALVFYANTFFITPIFFKNIRKYYILSALFLFLTFQTCQWAPSDYHFSNTNAIALIILIIFILSFSYGYIRIKLKTKEKNFNLKLGAKESELNLLKSQVNPHFLFNTLNNLYATALEENASKTSQSIAKLASLIRYMQEDIYKDYIPLLNEVNYIQDYITIQKLRCAVEPQIEIKFANIERHSISPGLLIPFVENAFKYGINPSKKSKLIVSVICDKQTIYFECVNSYQEDYKTFEKEQGFGIGIENSKQRLELVYPSKHTFKIVKEKSVFSVNISINTK